MFTLHKMPISVLAVFMGMVVCSTSWSQDNQKKSQEAEYQFDGCADLDSWLSDGNRKNDWTLNEDKQLVCEAESHMYQRLEDLPDLFQIDVVLSWKTQPNFAIGLGAPLANEELNRNRLLTLENWEDAVVISASDNFDVVLESMDVERKKAHFKITFDRNTGSIIVKDGDGEVLANSKLGSNRGGFGPGISLINGKRGDLVVEKLTITEVEEVD